VYCRSAVQSTTESHALEGQVGHGICHGTQDDLQFVEGDLRYLCLEGDIPPVLPRGLIEAFLVCLLGCPLHWRLGTRSRKADLCIDTCMLLDISRRFLGKQFLD
jgi:hypothetical protein